jgi:hypothetical protein
MLVASGPDGINKVIDKFIEKFSNYSKRQVEIKINEIAVKEKREDDNIKVWHIKPEFEYFLHMEEKAPSPSAVPAAPPADRKKPGPKKKVKTEGEDDGGEKNEESKEKSVKKEKTPKPKKEKDESEAHETAPKVTPAKRKAVEANIDTSNNLDDDIPSPPPTTPGQSGTAKEPKKSKSAFGLFVKSKRSEAEAKLSSDASVSENCLHCLLFIFHLVFFLIFPRMIN